MSLDGQMSPSTHTHTPSEDTPRRSRDEARAQLLRLRLQELSAAQNSRLRCPLCAAVSRRGMAIAARSRSGFYRQEVNRTVWEVPERYRDLKQIGTGAYGTVWWVHLDCCCNIRTSKLENGHRHYYTVSLFVFKSTNMLILLQYLNEHFNFLTDKLKQCLFVHSWPLSGPWLYCVSVGVHEEIHPPSLIVQDWRTDIYNPFKLENTWL